MGKATASPEGETNSESEAICIFPATKESVNRYDVAFVAKDVACRMEKQRCLFMTFCLSM